MQVLDKPLELVTVGGDPAKRVHRFVESEEHTETFGYEWTEYSRTYSDAALGTDLSRARLELNLGFPLEFLAGKNVLELGCGAGRFTEHLAQHAKHVVAVDLSRAVYVNGALGLPNVTIIQADLLKVPALSEPIDLVFCRGVLQHTVSPRDSMRRLFDYVAPGKLVIFDVYKRYRFDFFTFKYFWRPFFYRFVPLSAFDAFIKRHVRGLYAFHHAYLHGIQKIPIFRTVIGKTPLFLGTDWEKQYPHLSIEQRYEIFKNELVDMLYATYDQPMTVEEVIEALASFGQVPYSFDAFRNHFRCKKSESNESIRVRITKNGIFKMQ